MFPKGGRYNTRFIFFVLSFLVCFDLVASTSVQECLLREFTFSNNQLKCLKSHPVTNSVINDLKTYKGLIKGCPTCKNAFLSNGGSKYISLFTKDFVALAIDRNDFGGYYLCIAFKGSSKVYRLWLYEIDTNVFQLREMVEESKIHLKLSKELDQILFKFWLLP